MKKSSIFILLLLILPFVSAVQINMKSNYTQGETLIASVSGNFLTQIQQQNVFLYNGHVRISFIPIVQKIEGTPYIYGQLDGKSPGNYSLIISGITYSESGKTNSSDIIQNFTITNSSADFSIDPGVVASSNNFAINVQNLAGNSISVSSFLENSTMTPASSGIFGALLGESSASLTPTTITSISSGQTKQILFSVNASDQDQLIYAAFETNNTVYEIPVFITANATSQNNFQTPLLFEPQQETFSMSTNSNSSSFLLLYNSGQSQIVNLSVSNNLQSYVSVPGTVSLGTNSSLLIPINITSSPIENIIEGQIAAMSPNSTAYFTLTLNFSNSYVLPPNGTTLFQTCSQLSGIFCNNNETCSVPTQNAEDGTCCTGTCQPIPTNSSGIIIWILVVLVILIVIFFLIRRYRKAKRPFNLLDIARRKK